MTDPTRDAEQRSNPPVGPHGELATRPDQDMPPWTREELEHAERDLRATWQRERAHHLARAIRPPMGMPKSRTPGYSAAMVYLLDCLLYPVRFVTGLDGAPDDTTAEALARTSMLVVPEPEQRRCERCGTRWVRPHVPGGPLCDDARDARQLSQRDD